MPDVLVIGGGNAGLCAALAARERKARVVVLEKAPQALRGGNSKYTRNLRCAEDGLYSEDEFLGDLLAVSGPAVDPALVELLIARSRAVPRWMEAQGVRWQSALRGTLQLARTNRFFLGGGKALLNVYYTRAERLGVEVLYDACVTDLVLGEDGSVSALVELPGGPIVMPARSVVIASGGFEANFEWLASHWGPAAAGFVVRGSRFNDGEVVRRLHGIGALERGRPGQVHAIAVDARSPRFDAGIVTRVDSIPFGIVVNRAARRFHDEGQDLWPKRYASWGELIAGQPGQVAFSVFESRHLGSFIPPVYPPLQADTILDLAQLLDLDPIALAATVDQFNQASGGVGEPDFTRLDGYSTTGLTPPKSNWAAPLERPPFCAYPLRTGITFTYYGLAVDRRARVLHRDGTVLQGLYAGGEAIAGNFLAEGYLAGIGMTIGTVFGRIAGEAAAEYALGRAD